MHVSPAPAETGLPGQVAYTAAKAGIVGMMRTLAAEWGPPGAYVHGQVLRIDGGLGLLSHSPATGDADQ